MDEKTREKMVSAFENAVIAAGAKDFESGMAQARKLLAFAWDGMASIQTKDDFRKTLDSCVSSRSEEQIALLVFKFLPHILRSGLNMAAKKAASTLPPMPGGRPRSTNASQNEVVVNAILELIGKGCTPRVAKERIGQKFGLSRRTIYRIWQTRGSVLEVEPTIEDAIRYISTGSTN